MPTGVLFFHGEDGQWFLVVFYCDIRSKSRFLAVCILSCLSSRAVSF